MRFLLDTNAVIAVMRGASRICSALQLHRPGDFGVSAVAAYELCFAAVSSRRMIDNLVRVRALPFEVVPFDREDAEAAGVVRAKLAKAGRMMGGCDVMIAGQALARGLVLVSRYAGEFGRVEGLGVEDWEG